MYTNYNFAQASNTGWSLPKRSLIPPARVLISFSTNIKGSGDFFDNRVRSSFVSFGTQSNPATHSQEDIFEGSATEIVGAF